MALYLVSYDLDKPGQNYEAVREYLEGLGAVRFLYSEWFLVSDQTPAQVRDHMLANGSIDENDRILVCELKNHAAWKRLFISNESTREWFRQAT